MSDKFVISVRDSITDKLATFVSELISYPGTTNKGIVTSTKFEKAIKFSEDEARSIVAQISGSNDNGVNDYYPSIVPIDEDGSFDFCAREYFDAKHRIPRDEWQEYFSKIDKLCCGWSLSPRENDTFYYKSEAEDTIWDKDGNYQPNFIYNPAGFKMCWYKYPLRSCYANRDIDFDSFKEMVDACLASLKAQPLKECVIRY